MDNANIGMIGLAVMGENLVLNMESHGFRVAVYNRTVAKVKDFVNGRAKGKNIVGCESITDLVAALEKPRMVMLMVKAGDAVDSFIEQLLPLLDNGDIIIDGGNSYFKDSMRRAKYVESKGKLFIGTGISGGEEGALKGPSIMPGGSPAAWEHVKPIFQAIAARNDEGTPCCDWVGENGAGHFVKMVHNGIEYGDLQIIGEAYDIMKRGVGMSLDEMRDTFAEWDKGELNSYLIQITADILGYRTPEGEATVEKILDAAGQKGTGKWAGITALEVDQPLTLIAEAVFARCLSADKQERIDASKVLSGPQRKFQGDKRQMLEDLRQAVYASKLISYAQGFQLMRTCAKVYSWNLNYGGVAVMWQGGCIIRSAFLKKIKEAYDTIPSLENLLLYPFFRDAVVNAQEGWRRTLSEAIMSGIPMPAISSALAFFDGYRTERLPANLLQAQRDYFGAHTYERIDSPRGKFFHTNWTGTGGATSAETYNA